MARGHYNKLSNDTCNNIINFVISEGQGISATSNRFKILYSTVQTIVKKFRREWQN